MARATPEQRAILNTAALDENFADREFARNLAYQKLAAQKEANEQQLGLTERALRNQKWRQRHWADLRDRQWEAEQDQMKAARWLGLGNTLLGTYFGWRNMQDQIKRANLLNQDLRGIRGLG